MDGETPRPSASTRKDRLRDELWSRPMSRTLPIPPPGFDDHPVGEQIGYVQDLWDRITANVQQASLADWQCEILEERLAAHRAAPDEAWPWDDALPDLRERLRRAR